MFGTSGIRGIYGKDITEALAMKVSAVFAGDRLVVGRDIRESGPSLVRAVSEGATRIGADVISCGIVPTPTLALATKKYLCRGIMVTASHNPQEYNGLKLIENGKEIGKAMEKEVVRRYALRMPEKADDGSRFSDNGVLEDHKALASLMVDREAIRKKPKVIVDCNGAASSITPYLLTDLGCRVVSVNSSEHCFNRQSEPNEKNLAYLSGLITGSGADFAIAHDGDGDRCIIFDERGQMLPLDIQLAIMIEHELEKSKNKKIVSTVEASLVIREVVENAGGSIDITPVGSTNVGDRLEESGAAFGGEPAGEYIYGKGVHVPDAVVAAAKFAEIFCTGGRFSQLRKKYRTNFMFREKFQASDKMAAIERIKSEVRIEGRARCDDGIRVDEEDGWFLIRASGTEPIIRLTMEYREKGKAERRKAELSELIRKFTI
jgi:phosphoglucosamine mutase